MLKKILFIYFLGLPFSVVAEGTALSLTEPSVMP